MKQKERISFSIALFRAVNEKPVRKCIKPQAGHLHMQRYLLFGQDEPNFGLADQGAHQIKEDKYQIFTSVIQVLQRVL